METPKPQDPVPKSKRGWVDTDEFVRRLTRWSVVGGASLFAVLFLIGAIVTIKSRGWVGDVAREHFAATIGLSFAALAALCLVFVLEISTGKIEIKGLGFEFKGAGGPLVMWIFCFLAIVSAIKILW